MTYEYPFSVPKLLSLPDLLLEHRRHHLVTAIFGCHQHRIADHPPILLLLHLQLDRCGHHRHLGSAVPHRLAVHVFQVQQRHLLWYQPMSDIGSYVLLDSVPRIVTSSIADRLVDRVQQVKVRVENLER
jgi:hypothetical protein